MKDKKLQLGLLIGATVLAVVVIMICVFTGNLDMGGSSVPTPENQVVIEEISEGEIKGYYLTESGRQKQVNIPVADTVTVEDVNGQEIGMTSLLPRIRFRYPWARMQQRKPFFCCRMIAGTSVENDTGSVRSSISSCPPLAAGTLEKKRGTNCATLLLLRALP